MSGAGGHGGGEYSDLVDLLGKVVPGIPARADRLLAGSAILDEHYEMAKKLRDKVRAALDEIIRRIAAHRAAGFAADADRQAAIADLAAALGTLGELVEDHVRAQGGFSFRTARLKGEIAAIAASLGTLPAAAPAPPAPSTGEGHGAEGPGGLTAAAGAAAARAGIGFDDLQGLSLEHCAFDRFNDDRLITAVPCGKGGVNTTWTLTFPEGNRVFKKQMTVDEMQGSHIVRTVGRGLGIDIEHDARFGNRNVASGILGEMLGTPVICDTVFGIHGGEIGIMMSHAPGVPAGKLSQHHKDLIARDAQVQASLHRQVQAMELCDYLAGQIDRNHGNYIIDLDEAGAAGVKVTVTGIDNDFCFGSDLDGLVLDSATLPEEIRRAEEGGRFYPNVPACGAGCALGNPPLLVARDMADRVMAMAFDRDLAPRFASLLTDKELCGMHWRLKALQHHIRGLEATGCIVDDWATWRHPETDQDAPVYLRRCGEDSLFKRLMNAI